MCQTCGLDAGPLGGTGAAIMARDEHVVRMALHHSRRNDAHAILRDQLDTDAGAWVAGLEVVDELRQILNGVDVVVRGR